LGKDSFTSLAKDGCRLAGEKSDYEINENPLLVSQILPSKKSSWL